MQSCQTTPRQIVEERLMQADIRRANSELLLFATLFGTARLKQMAKAELSKRACCHNDEIDYCGADRDFSIVANF
jgi:hypothetical protein